MRQTRKVQNRRFPEKTEVLFFFLNNYCEKEKRIREFVLRRTNEGTVWQCEHCAFVIPDLTKYRANYDGLPVPESKVKQPKILYPEG
jgi:hypothetical protein